MLSLCRLRTILPHLGCRPLSTKTRFNVQLDEHTADDLQAEVIKHRKHAGVDKTSVVSVPNEIVQAMGKSLKEFPAKSVLSDAITLNRYLRSRHPPVEAADIANRRTQFEKEVADQMQEDFGQMSKEQALKIRKQNAQKVNKLIYQRTYNWKPIEYDSYKALQYLLGRSAPEYSTIVRIFREIAQRQPDFKPQSFFDFGSGVGTGTWAASQLWRKSIFEYYLVDVSRDMNDLADLLLRGGEENRHMELKNVNFRQFLPASSEVKYDVVLSAYSLLELPDTNTRLETLQTLWNKCDRFLVIVEQGTLAGFKVLNEARDFILYTERKTKICQVFAPCPHDLACPRVAAADGTPCNFLSAHRPLPFGLQNEGEVKYEPYSYVVLEKRHPNDISRATTDEWPRLVRPTLVRSKHSVCRMCTARGQLDEIIFTQSQHGKHTYRCARSSRWGDRLPIRVEKNDAVPSQTDNNVAES